MKFHILSDILLLELSLFLLEFPPLSPYCCCVRLRILPSCSSPYKVHKNKKQERAYLEGTFTDSLVF